MIVQIYEVNSPLEAKQLADIGVDHVGVLVGQGKFPRELTYDKALAIFQSLPQKAKSVALSLEYDEDRLSELVEKINPEILHLGTLPELLTIDKIKNIQNQFPKLKIMRSIPVVNKSALKIAKAYNGIIDYLLLDTYQTGDTQIGATGIIHDWSISRSIVDKISCPVILAGGLGPENVAEAIEKICPAGVDSKTKTDYPGSHRKDLEKVKRFVQAAKQS